jgi:hypothetical protein
LFGDNVRRVECFCFERDCAPNAGGASQGTFSHSLLDWQ